MPELQKLRVRIFQQPDGGLRSGRCVENKGCVPSGNDQVVRVVRHVTLKHLRALLVGQGCQFSADNLADFSSMLLQKRGAIGGPGDGMEMNYGIIFIEPVRVGLYQRGTD